MQREYDKTFGKSGGYEQEQLQKSITCENQSDKNKGYNKIMVLIFF